MKFNILVLITKLLISGRVGSTKESPLKDINDKVINENIPLE